MGTMLGTFSKPQIKSADVAQLVEQLIRNCYYSFTFNNLTSPAHPLNPCKSLWWNLPMGRKWAFLKWAFKEVFSRPLTIQPCELLIATCHSGNSPLLAVHLPRVSKGRNGLAEQWERPILL
jgi:hypothetical protein